MTAQRQPDITRAKLIDVAIEEFTARGYEGASLSNIICKAGLSKGGLYHHFSSKQALAYAAFDEVLLPEFVQKWDDVLGQDDLIQAFYDKITTFAEQVSKEELSLGCPMIKLASELGRIDPGIGGRAQTAFTMIRERFLRAFDAAQQRNKIKAEVEPKAIAAFVVASLQGLSIQAQHSGDLDSYRAGVGCLAEYIYSLKS